MEFIKKYLNYFLLYFILKYLIFNILNKNKESSHKKVLYYKISYTFSSNILQNLFEQESSFKVNLAQMRIFII
jgi:hypothetical protein